MFDAKELEVIATSLDLTKKTLPFLEQFNIENDDFSVSVKRLIRKIPELLRDAKAKEKAEAEKASESK